MSTLTNPVLLHSLEMAETLLLCKHSLHDATKFELAPQHTRMLLAVLQLHITNPHKFLWLQWCLTFFNIDGLASPPTSVISCNQQVEHKWQTWPQTGFIFWVILHAKFFQCLTSIDLQWPWTSTKIGRLFTSGGVLHVKHEFPLSYISHCVHGVSSVLTLLAANYLGPLVNWQASCVHQGDLHTVAELSHFLSFCSFTSVDIQWPWTVNISIHFPQRESCKSSFNYIDVWFLQLLCFQSITDTHIPMPAPHVTPSGTLRPHLVGLVLHTTSS